MDQNSIRDPGTEDTAVLAAGVGALPHPPDYKVGVRRGMV